MQDSPDIDMIRPFDVADRVRKSGQRPASKPGDAQLVSVARRADRGMPTEETVRIFQNIKRGQASPAPSFKRHVMASSTSRLALSRGTTGLTPINRCACGCDH